MLLPTSLPALLALYIHPSSAEQEQQQHLFSNPPPAHTTNTGYHIPSIHESAIQARRILHLSTLGTLVTSFPSHQHATPDYADSQEQRPDGVENAPIGLMEYYADCEADGNPTMLAIDIATPYKNYQAGSNISLSVRWWPRASHVYSTFKDEDGDGEDIPTPHTPAALPRFSLHGHLEILSATELATKLIPACFLRAHPDSFLWQPGNNISHESEYVRFVVEQVYWFGGFGDRARIDWLPIEEWRGVTMEEVAAIRLPGEKGYKERVVEGEWKEWL